MFRFDTGQSWFKDGWKAWVSYTIKNAPTDLTVKGITEKVMVTVIVEFIVYENGDVVILKSSNLPAVKMWTMIPCRSMPTVLPGRMRFNIIIP